VIYLFHGLRGHHGSWLDNSMLPVFAKDYNAVFIMPDAEKSFYTDMKYGGKFFTWVGKELPALCKKVFHISAKRVDTALIGWSLGGYGALKCALSYPGRYGFCGAISSSPLYLKKIVGALRSRGGEWAREDPANAALLLDLYAALGEDLPYNPANDVSELAKRASRAAHRPAIYSACGRSDALYAENLRFRDDMKKLKFDFTFEEWDGGHDWEFFNKALRRALEKWRITYGNTL
jgi:S-formylglutathione hydrolase FrmB